MNRTTDLFLEEHLDAMLEDLKMLVGIPSIKGEARPGMPFGEGPANALAAAEALMGRYGLATKNYDNYVVTGDLNNQEKGLDILAHLDVVPVSDDWTVTQPFAPKVVDGRIYGRGTADDKGPAIAALYAMRAVRECGIPLQKNVRLILGSDEECGSADLKYYYGIEQEAPASFTPDAEFPLINLEKGRLERQFSRTFAQVEAVADTIPHVVEIHGGDKANVVPGSAWAVVTGLAREVVLQAIEHDETGVLFTVEASGGAGTLRIAAKGIAAHASTPDGGKNAICALLGLLARLPFSDTPQMRALCAVARLFPFGDNAGRALGVEMQDEISGALTMNLGIFHFDGRTLAGTFDARVPVCGTDATVTEVLRQKFQEKGFEMEGGRMVLPHYVPEDSPLVQALLQSYERYTGIQGKPLAIGGGTYVHELKRGVAFGCMHADVDNHMHGDDEFMCIDVLLQSAKIFADAICRLCGA